ncbi:MAG TPA: hypothetical protein VG273_24320 [Bryobacteraceae bacterium]|jgi:photosystem II stability/assembly factor-like uncharacterized protein|nr:hypothetical protein [Bryobacteraceae bacterium]
MKFLALLLLAHAAFAQTWLEQSSGTTASLRAVSAVNARVVWASGAGGTWLRTIDSGANWRAATVPGAADLDFRGVQALNENTAWLMSSGSGDKSRIYKTTDAGATWKLLFTNPDPQGFFDAIAFRDALHGVIAGDPVNGDLTIFTSDDGGSTWTRRHTLPAHPEEGAFAASNSCLALTGKRDIWFGTGGLGGAHILHSADGGATWNITPAPIRHDEASAGIFSIAFADASHGIAVGGNYAKDGETDQNLAVTSDGGRTWSAAPAAAPKGFRSAVLWLPAQKAWLATGTSGSDISTDGKSWRNFHAGSFNALATSQGSVWAVGARGRVATMKFSR